MPMQLRSQDLRFFHLCEEIHKLDHYISDGHMSLRIVSAMIEEISELLDEAVLMIEEVKNDDKEQEENYVNIQSRDYR